jgi:5-methylcytosine-specific restriction protein A
MSSMSQSFGELPRMSVVAGRRFRRWRIVGVPTRLPTINGPRQPRQSNDRPPPSRRGYGRNWRRCRLMKLAADPLCQDCKEEGIVTEATEVDHVDGDTTNLSDENLRSLCKSHHSRKTCRQDGGLGRGKPTNRQGGVKVTYQADRNDIMELSVSGSWTTTTLTA